MGNGLASSIGKNSVTRGVERRGFLIQRTNSVEQEGGAGFFSVNPGTTNTGGDGEYHKHVNSRWIDQGKIVGINTKIKDCKK